MKISSSQIEEFQKTVIEYYATNKRDMPWRQPNQDGTFDAYQILVSELMLQQTQVARVIPKYLDFISKFPTVEQLSRSEFGDVLQLWSGLGYSRRARYLWQSAQIAHTKWADSIPDNFDQLVSLPGVGPNTAGAILAYAFNQPVAFIETNIRTVFIYHFFKNQEAISDKQLVPYIEASLPPANSQGLTVREWYWALMDYGSFLKLSIGNISTASKHYAKQSKFDGSVRQLRGRILRLLQESPHQAVEIEAAIVDERLGSALDSLIKDGLVQKQGDHYRI